MAQSTAAGKYANRDKPENVASKEDRKMELQNRKLIDFAELDAIVPQPYSADDTTNADRFDTPINCQRKRAMEAFLSQHENDVPEMSAEAHAELHLVENTDTVTGKSGATKWTVEAIYLELKRRGVVQAATSYVVISWVIAQVAELVSDIFRVPDWALQALLIALAIGLPIALIVAWAFELTPDGLKRDIDISPKDPAARKPGLGVAIAIVALIVLAVSTLLVSQEDMICNAPPQARSGQPVVPVDSKSALYFQSKSTTLGSMPLNSRILGESR